MRFIFALVLAGMITGFVVASDSLPFCAEWCQIPAVMLGVPGTLALVFAPNLPVLGAHAVTFLVWMIVFWLIFRGSHHRYHVHDRIPHRSHHRRHHHHVRDRLYRR